MFPLYFTFHIFHTMSLPQISITPLLKRLWPAGVEPHVSADEIAAAISHIFTNQLSPVQIGALLTCLHFTGRDRTADVIAKCAKAMRDAAAPLDRDALAEVVKRKNMGEGHYKGGLVSAVLSLNWTLLTRERSILLAREVILITLSTFQPLRPSWHHHFSL